MCVNFPRLLTVRSEVNPDQMNQQNMKIQIDLKSAAIGLAIGIGALFVVAADDNSGSARFQVSTGTGVVCIVNTQTGQAYMWKVNDHGDNPKFFGPKL